MKCPHCGADSGTSVQCPSCGQSITSSAQPLRQAPVQQPQQQPGPSAAGGPSGQQDPVAALHAKMEAINNGEYPPLIAQLDISEKCKRTFAFYETFKITQPYGLFPQPPAALGPALKAGGFKLRREFNKLALARIWWAFFFGPFYYMFAGMWRKGVALLLGLGTLVGIFEYAYITITGVMVSQSLNTGIGVGLGFMVSVMAMYDQYRSKVKGQTFWW